MKRKIKLEFDLEMWRDFNLADLESDLKFFVSEIPMCFAARVSPPIVEVIDPDAKPTKG